MREDSLIYGALFARPKTLRSIDLEKKHAVAFCSRYSWNKFVTNIRWPGKQESRPPCFEVRNGLKQRV
jgi:hypothetical protein